MSRKPDLIHHVIFNDKFNQMFDETVAPAQLLDVISPEETRTTKTKWISEKSDGKLACSYCQAIFPDVQVQREHYKLDWHRYNLKQSLSDKAAITEEEFSKKTENDDISSISGSDSEEENSLDTYATAQGKIFLQNKSGQIFSLYKCLFISDKKQNLTEIDYCKKLKETCHSNQQWTILMLGGGHFAGAVFSYLTPVVHKTFHCYTVRAGQGGSQSTKDGKSGSSHPKSAGASLRRYNEQALVDHVTKILSSWREEIKNSSLIFFRASGPYNRGVLFGGKEPLLNRSDPRLRPIPFSTGRATYAEVKRVHVELCSAVVYESLSEAVSLLAQQKIPERDFKSKVKTINRAKSREVIERPLPGELSVSSSEDEQETNLSSDILEISFEGLEEFGDSLTPEQRNFRKNRKKPKKSKNQKLREKEEIRKKNLIEIATKGNVLLLEEVLNERLKTFEHIPKEDVAQECFNETLDDNGNSFLHLAASNEHEDLLNYLLNNQADPCLKNKNQQTPYTCTTSKLSREIFKKFAKDNPDKYNYNKAHIPVNALTEEELAEKKRAQRKVKRVKEKEKKKDNQLKQKEEDHKQRFLNLSDREKRALAAEKRIINVQGKVIARCFLCGSDIAGKVPFEYLENRFCSIDCLKSHRMKSTQKI